MLQISNDAVALLEEARDEQEVPEEFGLRVFGQPTEDGRLQVRLAFIEEPEEGDQVVETAGTEVYVAPEVAEPLEGAVIDVEEGGDLIIRAQEDSGS